MKQQKKIDEASEAPNVTTDQVLKTFKLFKPNSALTYLAQQADMKPAEYLAKNIFKILGYSLKNGAIKAADLIGGLKKLNVKSGEDNTGIDYDSIDIDEDTIQFNVLFGDKDSKTAIIEFLNKYKESQDNIEEEIKEKAKEIQDDAKQKGITFSDKEIQENGVNIAIGVNELKDTPKKKIDPKKVKNHIDNITKEAEQIKQAKAKIDKAFSEIKNSIKKNKNNQTKSNSEKVKNKKVSPILKSIKKDLQSVLSKPAKKYLKVSQYKVGSDNYNKNIVNQNIPLQKFKDAEKLIVIQVSSPRKEKLIEDDNFKVTSFKSNNTKRKDIKEFVNKAKSLIKSNFKEISNICVFRKTFNGKYNSDDTKKLDSIYIIGIIQKTKKESQIDYYIVSSLKTKNTNIFLEDEFNADEEIDLNQAETFVKNKLAGGINGFEERLDAIEGAIKISKFNDEYEKCIALTDKFKSCDDPETYKKLMGELKELKRSFKRDGLDMGGDYQINGTENPVETKLRSIWVDLKDKQIEKTTRFGAKLAKGSENANELKQTLEPTTPNNNDISQSSPESTNTTNVKKKGGWRNGPLGWAIVAAKATGTILNNSKELTNALSRQVIKNAEDKYVIAQMTVLIENGETSDSNFQDSKFSVRFDVNDMKWHATNLDDRKMAFDEQKIIDKVLNTESGKKFKAQCLKIWKSIFKTDNGNSPSIISFVIKNADRYKIKIDKSIQTKISKMADNFDKIESAFK